jgi:hypothetical protein
MSYATSMEKANDAFERAEKLRDRIEQRQTRDAKVKIAKDIGVLELWFRRPSYEGNSWGEYPSYLAKVKALL